MESTQRRAATAVAVLALALPAGLAGSALAGDKGKGDERPGTAPGQSGDVPQGKANGHAGEAEREKAPKSKGAGKRAAPTPKGKAKGHARKGGRRGAERPAPKAAPNAAPRAAKVTICHATGSATNPYVRITIAESAVAAHRRHQDGRDIVPAPAAGCPTGQAAQQPPGQQQRRDDHGKVTICHATGSATNPYVVITISESAIPAHRNHQDGRDIIPAPAEGCPAPPAGPTGPDGPGIKQAAGPPAPGPPALGVLGEHVAGGPAAAPGAAPAAGVLGEQAEGGVAPEAAGVSPDAGVERRERGVDAVAGRLPFTGFDAWMIVVLALGGLLAGVALYRRSARRPS